MLIKAILATGLIAALMAQPAAAEEESFWYLEGGYHHITAESTTGIDLAIGAVAANLGYQFTNGLGIEAVIGQGVVEDTHVVLATDVTFSTDTMFAVAAKYSYAVTERWGVYGKARYTVMDIEAEFLNTTITATENDGEFGYGAGAYVRTTPKVYFLAEVNSFFEGGVSGFVGMGVRF